MIKTPFTQFKTMVLIGLASLAGCAAETAPSAAEAELRGNNLRVLAEFPDGFAIHGVGGDTALLFALQPSPTPTIPPGVHVARRSDGFILPDVTPPPDGFGVPLSIKIETFHRLLGGSEGRFLLLDTRVPPAQSFTNPAPAHVYRYSYRYTRWSGLVTTLLETHVLPLNTVPLDPSNPALPNGLVYPGSIALLPEGRVAVTDSVFGGSVWVSDDASLDTWSLALIDPRFAGGFRTAIEGIGTDASGLISDYSLLTPRLPTFPPEQGYFPGAHSITYAHVTDEVCFAVTFPGGIFCIGLDQLLDTSVPPFAKSGSYLDGSWGSVRVVVPPVPGLGDLTDGVDYDRFAPSSPWLYWQRAPADEAAGWCNRLRRVHLISGEIQDVACDVGIYNWANEISVLPPMIHGSCLTTILSSVGQEYNNPDVNGLLEGVSRYFAPSPMPVVTTTSF